MNWNNIWQHPKTSISGVLICVLTIVGVLSQQGITLGHAGSGTVIALIGALATALLGLLAQDPAKKQASLSVTKNTQKLGAVAIFVLLGSVMATAQNATNATVPPTRASPIANLYAAGVSYNGSASPSVACTALYTHLIADTGTYAFTAIDALPESTTPFTVNTGIGIGVAQRIATVANIPIYVPSSAGISFNGSNTGWQWNVGALASIHLKGDYYLMPTVRMVKSSVSNGSGYQPIIGVLFGWGK